MNSTVSTGRDGYTAEYEESIGDTCKRDTVRFTSYKGDLNEALKRAVSESAGGRRCRIVRLLHHNLGKKYPDIGQLLFVFPKIEDAPSFGVEVHCA